jgi:hypothetical protein
MPTQEGGLPLTPSGMGGDLGIGEMLGNVKAFGSNITNHVKTFIPTAVMIIAAVVILKIVLWLMRGRRR